MILDGKIMQKNLKHMGKDEKWLNHQIKAQGADKAENVLLAFCDQKGTLTVYARNTMKPPEDLWL